MSADDSGLRLVLRGLTPEVDSKFAVLCRAAFDGVVIHDNGTIVDANDKFASMLGGGVSEFLGRSVLDFIAPEMHATALQCDERPFETVALRLTGERVPVEVCAIAVDSSMVRIVAIRDLTERRAREAMERKRQERIRVLSQVAFDGICVHKNHILVEASDSFAKMTGYEPAELISMSVTLLFPASESVQALKGVPAGHSGEYETLCVRKDGTTFPVDVCETSTSAGERVLAIRDITARHAAEDALRASEDRFRDLVESSQDVIGVHDLEGRILSTNAAFRKAMNTPGKEFCNVREHLIPGSEAGFENYIDALRRDGVVSGTIGVSTNGGGPRLWEYHSSLRTEGVPAPVARIRARDITDRERSLAAAQLSEQHFRSIIENSSDLIAIIEPDGTLRYQSPSIERVLGLTADAFVGRQFIDLVHPSSVHKASDFLAHQLAKPDAEGMVELRFQHENRSWRSFEVVGRNITTDGVVSAIITNARDVTERKMLETQLAQANRLSSLGRLAATVAHEFNNVLMGMQPFTELMQRPNAAASMITKGAGHISNSIQRGRRIVLDILRFTQPAEPQTALVDVGEWWEKFAPEAEIVVGNSIQISCTIPSHGICVIADRQQLSQVMANLVANARDAMPTGGTLKVEADEPRAGATYEFGIVPNPDQYVHICVTDTGHGMSAEVAEHIFEPLFTTKPSGGTGLGLAVAHQVLTQHRGYIFAESEVGEGTRFHLFLPKGTSPCDDKCDVVTANDKARGLTILMVEDESIIVEGMSILLRAEGLNVVAVGTGGEAAAAVEEFHPDVVLLDFGLPDMDGSEVYAILRKTSPLLPVIFASGHADPRIRAGMADPYTRFLQKPFDGGTLLAMIDELHLKALPS